MILFTVQGSTCGLQYATEMLFLTSWLEAHVTGQHRYIKDVKYK